jgi:hypothetical protein
MKLTSAIRSLASNGTRLLPLAAALAILAPAAQAAAQAQAPRSGIEHFQAMSTNAAAASRVVVGYGLFTAAGVDHESSNGSHERFSFPGGSLKLTVTKFTNSQKIDPRTCLFTITRHVKYVLGDGTGSYTGVSGHGTGTARILGIAARSHGKCSTSAKPAAFQQIITASGPVTFNRRKEASAGSPIAGDGGRAYLGLPGLAGRAARPAAGSPAARKSGTGGAGRASGPPDRGPVLPPRGGGRPP